MLLFMYELVWTEIFAFSWYSVRESLTTTVFVAASARSTSSQILPDRHDSDAAASNTCLRCLWLRHQIHQDLWRLQREAGKWPPQRQRTNIEGPGRQGKEQLHAHLIIFSFYLNMSLKMINSKKVAISLLVCPIVVRIFFLHDLK